MSNLKLNTSYKHHFACAVILGIWLAAFLVLIAPFDVADVPFKTRLVEMPFYGLMTIVGYMALIPIQNRVNTYFQRWTLGFEVAFFIAMSLIMLVGCFAYYKSWVINGDYSLYKFTFEVYYPIYFIILPIMVFVRWHLNRQPAPTPARKIMLMGDYKQDILQVDEDELICISSADNYVEVVYKSSGDINRLLLRSTLKQIHEQAPILVKVHRSHIINPLHFIAWKDSNTIIVTGMEIPVSKGYKHNLDEIHQSSLNQQGLSLNT